ncbi:SIS domain-containing protein [Candidatus Parcubacteria bacterium]|nr:MAG: SIS domain-containing protein [Candidatus Parcubacteria bacterium]
MVKEYGRAIAVLAAESEWQIGGESVNDAAFLSALEACFIDLKSKNGRIYALGNGGSAAIASHLVVDLINTLGVSGHVLHDASLLSCFANDYGYGNAFSHLLDKLVTPHDMLILVSSSGASDNIIAAAEKMREIGGSIMSVTAFKPDNPLREITRACNGFSIWVPTSRYGYAEVTHQLILHALIDKLSESFL